MKHDVTRINVFRPTTLRAQFDPVAICGKGVWGEQKSAVSIDIDMAVTWP